MIEETHLLCDRIQKLTDDAVALVESDSLTEKRKQLQQISATIENLERVNVTIPQELITLSESLTTEVSQHDVAVQTLRTLHERLGGLAHDINPHVRVRGVRRGPRRADLPEITAEEDFYPVIVDVSREMGGSGSARRVLDAVFRAMEGRLLPGDHDRRP